MKRDYIKNNKMSKSTNSYTCEIVHFQHHKTKTNNKIDTDVYC